MAENHIKNIVLVGAGGNAGSAILSALLDTKRFNITILSRPDSKSTFPDTVKVVKGTYDDASFLTSAFKGADAVIITLSFISVKQEPLLVEAAIAAGVQWLIPNEYAGDGSNSALVDRVPVYHQKRDTRQLIEKLGGKYIGVSTGPWAELMINQFGWPIDIPNRTATLATGTGHFNTTTLKQVGLGVAALLSLPIINEQDPRRSLSHYANSFVYLSSLHITLDDLFGAVKRVTGTSDTDWIIKHEDAQEELEKADEALALGEMAAMRPNLFYNYVGEGRGGDVETKAAKDREVLGLQKEDLDTVVRSALPG